MNHCPACGATFESADFCPWCGLAQAGPEATELRELLGRLSAIDRDLYARSRERDELVTHIDAKRFQATRGAAFERPVAVAAPPLSAARSPRPAPPRVAPAPVEWNVDRVRTMLLWVGAALLAASALTFTAVAWSRLGDGGRAALLVTFTGISTMIAVGVRKRLPATAEAFTALTIALALIDWLALRRAGIGAAMSAETWWAIGSALIGLLSLVLGEVAARGTGRRAAAILWPTSFALMISIVAAAPWSAGLGLALLATAIALVYGRLLDDELLSAILAIEGIAAWIGAALAAGYAAAQPDTLAAAVIPALVVLALGAAPLVMRRRELALAVVPGAMLTFAGPALEREWLVVFATCVAGVVCACAPWVREQWRAACVAVGGAYAAAGLVLMAVVFSVTTFGPLAWAQHPRPWTGDLHQLAKHVVSGPDTRRWTFGGVEALIVAAAAIFALLAIAVPKRRVLAFSTSVLLAGAIATAATVAAPVLLGASAMVAFGIALTLGAAVLVAAASVDRGHPQLGLSVLGVAALALIPTAGWALMTSSASVVALLVAMLAAAGATDLARSENMRAIAGALAGASAVALAGVWAIAIGVVTFEAGFIVTVTAGAILVLGALWRREAAEGPVLEIIGAAGMVAGVSMAAPSHAWFAGAITVAFGALLLAALRRERTIVYVPAAAATAIGATAAWLAAAGVPIAEAGFIVGAAASAVLLFGVHGRRGALDGPVVEAIGLAGMFVGAVITAPSHAWLAGALTLATPVFALAALRRDRALAYGAAAAATALGATWAWLAVAGVTVVEAYTLPAAAVALGAGLIAWRQPGPGRSWLAFGPAIVIGLGPTLDLAIQHNDPGRTILTAAVAASLMLVGAHRRLQAPLVLGASALLLLAVDTFGPAAARLPRWVPLAIAGVLLMWVGARFERSRDAARRASRAFHGFG